MTEEIENPKRIVLIGKGRQLEAEAASAITPGDLIQRNADGEVLRHSAEGGGGECLIAMEDALQGRTINDDYEAGEVVTHNIPLPGDVLYLNLKAGEDVSLNDDLISAGDGTFIAAASASSGVASPVVMFKAHEDLDLSDSGAVNGRIRARKI